MTVYRVPMTVGLNARGTFAPGPWSGPVDARRIQRTAEAMFQFGLLGQQYAAEVQQGTLVESMIGPVP